MSWLQKISEANSRFKETIEIDALPTQRHPCPYAVVTCMDPRVNLQAAGVSPFESNGKISSHLRVIRTLGAMADHRSLVVGIHLAGFKEIAVIMHTDCGCSLAYSKIDVLIDNLHTNLSPEKLSRFKQHIGEPFRANLREWLRAFEDPRQAVTQEVENIKAHPFVPDDLIVHGLVYHLSTGTIEIVVNGYE